VCGLRQTRPETLGDIFGVGPRRWWRVALFYGRLQPRRAQSRRAEARERDDPLFSAHRFFGCPRQASTTLHLFATTDPPQVARVRLRPVLPDVNSVFIIVLAPVLAWLWFRISARTRRPERREVRIGMSYRGPLRGAPCPRSAPHRGGRTDFNPSSATSRSRATNPQDRYSRVSGTYLHSRSTSSPVYEMWIWPVAYRACRSIAPARSQGMVMDLVPRTRDRQYIAGPGRWLSESAAAIVLLWTLIRRRSRRAGLFFVDPISDDARRRRAELPPRASSRRAPSPEASGIRTPRTAALRRIGARAPTSTWPRGHGRGL